MLHRVLPTRLPYNALRLVGTAVVVVGVVGTFSVKSGRRAGAQTQSTG